MKQEIEELAIKCATNSQYLSDFPHHEASVKYGFIAGYSLAIEQPKWVDVDKNGLPTDNSVGYFIAKNQFFHKTLYKLSELLEKNNEYEITHYLPFRLPPPPNQTK